MGDKFTDRVVLSDPSSDYFVATPHDSNDEAAVSRGLYVGTAGNVTAVRPDGTTCLFTAVPAGAILPIRAKRINSTATTASTIVFLV